MNNTSTTNLQLFSYENKEIRYYKAKETLLFRVQDLLDIVGLKDFMSSIDIPGDYSVYVEQLLYVTEAGVNWMYSEICIKYKEKEKQFATLRKSIYGLLNNNKRERSTERNEIKLFSYENKEIRTVTIDGDPWWIAKDVAELLGYVWCGTKTVQHVPKIWRGVGSVPTPTGIQQMAILSEHGLYFFLNRSDKEKALPFQMWVNGTILPQIRKTGRYSIDEDLESRRIKNECKAILEAIYNATLPGSSITIRSLIDEITTKSIEDYRDPVKRLLCKHGIRVD